MTNVWAYTVGQRYPRVITMDHYIPLVLLCYSFSIAVFYIRDQIINLFSEYSFGNNTLHQTTFV